MQLNDLEVKDLQSVSRTRGNLLHHAWSSALSLASLIDKRALIRDLKLLRPSEQMRSYLQGKSLASSVRAKLEKKELLDAFTTQRKMHEKVRKQKDSEALRKSIQKVQKDTNEVHSQVHDLKEKLAMLKGVQERRRMAAEMSTATAYTNLGSRHLSRVMAEKSQVKVPGVTDRTGRLNTISATEPARAQTILTTTRKGQSMNYPFPPRLDSLIERSRLSAVVKAQDDEILKLQKELETLRKKTFPTI